MHEPSDLNAAIFQLFRQFSNLQLQRVGHYQGQGLILIQLKEQGTLTQRQLADITKRRPATMSEQLESMERAGLIRREKNANDKRNIDVMLTEAGLTAAKDAEAARKDAADDLFAALTLEEKYELRRQLTKLVNSLDKEINSDSEI